MRGLFDSLTYLAFVCWLGCAQSSVGLMRRDTASSSLSAPTPPLAFHARAEAPHAAPLYLEVWGVVHGSAVGPLLPGMTLHSGDRIGLQARTSSVANVYVIHCDSSEAISVFPASGPIAFPADRRVDLPAVGKDLRLTTAPGDEILYVVASKRPLDESDPALQALLSRSKSGDDDRLCGGTFEASLAGRDAPRHAHDRTGRGQPLAALRGIASPEAYPSGARAFANDDGVIVLRFPYRHLP
ncbi:MAG TPA: hypothetical protein VGI70_13760 [Polyangiales bacterium]